MADVKRIAAKRSRKVESKNKAYKKRVQKAIDDIPEIGKSSKKAVQLAASQNHVLFASVFDELLNRYRDAGIDDALIEINNRETLKNVIDKFGIPNSLTLTARPTEGTKNVAPAVTTISNRPIENVQKLYPVLKKNLESCFQSLLDGVSVQATCQQFDVTKGKLIEALEIRLKTNSSFHYSFGKMIHGRLEKGESLKSLNLEYITLCTKALVTLAVFDNVKNGIDMSEVCRKYQVSPNLVKHRIIDDKRKELAKNYRKVVVQAYKKAEKKKTENAKQIVSDEYGITVEILDEWLATIDMFDDKDNDDKTETANFPIMEDEVITSESPEPPDNISDITDQSSDGIDEIAKENTPLKPIEEIEFIEARTPSFERNEKDSKAVADTTTKDNSDKTDENSTRVTKDRESNDVESKSPDSTVIDVDMTDSDSRAEDSDKIDISEEAKLAITKGLPLMNVSLLYGIPFDSILKWMAQDETECPKKKEVKKDSSKTKEVIEISDDTPTKKKPDEDAKMKEVNDTPTKRKPDEDAKMKEVKKDSSKTKEVIEIVDDTPTKKKPKEAEDEVEEETIPNLKTNNSCHKELQTADTKGKGIADDGRIDATKVEENKLDSQVEPTKSDDSENAKEGVDNKMDVDDNKVPTGQPGCSSVASAKDASNKSKAPKDVQSETTPKPVEKPTGTEYQNATKSAVIITPSSDVILDEVANYCLKMSKIGYFYTRSQVNKIANSLFQTNKIEFSKDIEAQLLKHPIITPILTESNDASSPSTEHISCYYSQLKSVLDTCGLFNRPDRIWLLDETMLLCHKDSPSFTVVACANAAGKVVPPYIICQGDKKGSEESSNKSVLTYTCRKGEATSSEAYLTFFREHFPKYSNAPSIVLVDGQNASIGLPVIDILGQNGIMIHVLPPHMSHVSRLSRGEDLLGPFPRNLSQVIYEIFSVQSRKRIVRDELFDIVSNVYNLSYTKENIVTAFTKMKICPYSPWS